MTDRRFIFEPRQDIVVRGDAYSKVQLFLQVPTFVGTTPTLADVACGVGVIGIVCSLQMEDSNRVLTDQSILEGRSVASFSFDMTSVSRSKSSWQLYQPCTFCSHIMCRVLGRPTEENGGERLSLV